MFGVDLFPSEKRTVPGWSGFNAVVHSCVPVLTNIGYCLMIDGSPTEFWPRSALMYCTFFLNVYTVLNSVGEQSISKKKDQCCDVGCPLTVNSVFIFVIIVTCNLYKNTSGNVSWQYYPEYITIGNDLICNYSVHCLYIINCYS